MVGGRVVLVTGAEQPVGAGLAAALRGAGATVGLVAGDLADKDGAARAVAAAVAEVGAPHALVHAWVEPLALELRPLADVDDDRWAAVWEGTMQASLWLCQAVFPHLDGHGRVVFVTPTISLSGAPNLVPWTTAIEAQRLLAKSAARQWGANGITVNCVAPSAALYGVEVGSEMALAAPALGRAGDVDADLGPLVAFLCSEASHFLTGSTLTADGGTWMAP